MRIIVDIQGTGTFNLDDIGIRGNDIQRIWTVYDEDILWNSTNFDHLTGKKIENKTLEDLNLRHEEGVFLEDYVHDWNIREGNVLYYYSRVVATGRDTKILIEY